MWLEEWERLVRWCAARVFPSCGRARVSYEELLQAGRIALWEVLARYDSSRGSFLGFASHRVQGAMRDLLRAERRRAERCEVLGWAQDRASSTMDPDLAAALRDVVATLPAEHQQMVWRFAAGEHCAEIGAALGLSSQYVSHLLQKSVFPLLRARMEGHNVMTLLDKARASAKYAAPVDGDDDNLAEKAELALAYIRGQVTGAQVAVAVGLKPGQVAVQAKAWIVAGIARGYIEARFVGYAGSKS